MSTELKKKKKKRLVEAPPSFVRSDLSPCGCFLFLPCLAPSLLILPTRTPLSSCVSLSVLSSLSFLARPLCLLPSFPHSLWSSLLLFVFFPS